MKKFRIILAAVLVSILGFSLSCQNELKVTAIGGSVRDGVTGGPLAGATVTFAVPADYFKSYKKMLLTATADSNGRWFLEDLPPDIQIRVSFQATGFQSYEMDVLTPGDGEYREVTVTLYQYFTQDDDPRNAVYGTLYDANTSLALPGAAVHLEFRAGTVVIDTTTDPAGNFWISELAAEGFNISISKDGYHTLAVRINWCGGLNMGNQSLLDQIGCGDLDLGNLSLGSNAAMTVEVADENGNPLVSAQVILIPDCTGLCAEDVQNGTTDEYGSISFEVTLGANYSVTAVSADGSLRGSDLEPANFLKNYVGIDCGEVGTDTLTLVSSNNGDDSVGGVLRLVFDQPVQIVGVELDHYTDADVVDDLVLDRSGITRGASFSLASGGYQLVISPLVVSGPIESGDHFSYNWEVKSTVNDGTEQGFNYSVNVH
ncbi:MAG: carboxypeptidase-like regulatory domain-containing protein [Proteobacteria bacterium]|nr:carboxypeptidase-like regulatory domain-containing protein [Pseudomonadota bacterium]